MEVFWAPDEDENYVQLRHAATQGDEKLLYKLIVSGIRLDAYFTEDVSSLGMGTTALHIAAHRGHTNVVRMLLDHGVDVEINTMDPPQGSSTESLPSLGFLSPTAPPIWFAVSAARPDTTKTLLDAGARTDGLGLYYDSILTAVLTTPQRKNKARIEVLHLLLDHGVDIEVTHEHQGHAGPTVLERAIENNDQEVIHLLSDRGASFENALFAALRHTDISLFHVLIDAGASDVDFRVTSAAAARGNFELVKILLANDDSASKAAAHSEPVTAAVRTGQVDMTELLLDLGFALDQPDKEGITPLHQAFTTSRPQLGAMQFLLDRGADPFATSVDTASCLFGDKYTILQTSARMCHLSMIMRIIKIAPELVNFRARTVDGLADTALMAHTHALGSLPDYHTCDVPAGAMPTRLQGISILLGAGARVNDQDNQGRTALHILAANRREYVRDVIRKAVHMLLGYGADPNIRDNDGHQAYDLANDEEIKRTLIEVGSQ